MTPELLMSITAGKALSLDHIPGGSRPEWTAEDAAIACRGLDRARYAAFALRWAKDLSQRSALKGCLMRAAVDVALKEQWPERLQSGHRYLERIVDLAIWEELNSIQSAVNVLITRRPAQAAEFIRGRETQELRPHILAAMISVSIDVWESELRRRYEGIRDVLEGWCSDARAHVQPQLWGGDIDDQNSAA